MQQLTSNTLLQGEKYRIEKVLGQGGFGITYLAEQVMLGRKVAIKEFFMKEFCERNADTSCVSVTGSARETVDRYKEKFLKEARNIAKLNHSNIIRVIDVFNENDTAYYVMEYAEKGSLADKVKREGYLTEPVATRYIKQVAEALAYIHQNKMNHLDIKPGNILVNDKDEAVLIDFGLSKQYDVTTGNQTSSTPVGISEGYAPMEQYKQGGVGEFSPETDIYALGATFFKLLTGVTPPSAADIYEDGVPVNELTAKSVSQKTIDIICKAMQSRKRDRIKEVIIFINGLQTDSNNSVDTDLEEETILSEEKTLPQSKGTIIGVNKDNNPIVDIRQCIRVSDYGWLGFYEFPCESLENFRTFYAVFDNSMSIKVFVKEGALHTISLNSGEYEVRIWRQEVKKPYIPKKKSIFAFTEETSYRNITVTLMGVYKNGKFISESEYNDDKDYDKCISPLFYSLKVDYSKEFQDFFGMNFDLLFEKIEPQ